MTSYKEVPRTAAQIFRLLQAALKDRFVLLDHEYNVEDSKMTSRLGMETLHRILTRCDVEISWEELTLAWKGFDLAADGLYTWRKFCQYYLAGSDNNQFVGDDSTEEIETNAKMTDLPAEGTNNLVTDKKRRSKEPSDSAALKLKLKPFSKALKNDFKKADIFNTGCVPVSFFGKTVSSLGLNPGNKELFSLANEYDTDLTGNVNYKALLFDLK